jgi:prepilin signal peptidase PulO-like enzyme (type II secretory pathway)
MTLLYALVGLLAGCFLNRAGDYLPRFASSSTTPPPEPNSWPVPALWQALTSLILRKRPLHLQKSLWPGVAVELFAALLFACLWERFGLSWKLLLVAANCSFFLLIAVIDLKYRLVLNMLIYPAAAVTLFLRSVPPGRDTLITLLGGVVGLSPFLLVALVKPGGMGGGDVKLAALIGLMVGFPQVLWALALGILAGGITAFLLLLTRRWGPKSYIPYAPFLCLGALFSLVYPVPMTFSP